MLSGMAMSAPPGPGTPGVGWNGGRGRGRPDSAARPGQRVRELRRGGVLLLAHERAQQRHGLRGLCARGRAEKDRTRERDREMSSAEGPGQPSQASGVSARGVRVSALRSARMPLKTTSVRSSSSAVLICGRTRRGHARPGEPPANNHAPRCAITAKQSGLGEDCASPRLARDAALQGHSPLRVKVPEILRTRPRGVRGAEFLSPLKRRV